ncbi:ribbon-helix-helix protein, CopG family [Gaoshiqia sediminis]|uniref:Ribbon-helix-helix protein, CopG family n=1 Tax=Gaoshiqia sediminis TaxID=2986998 RepID=A0AA41Y9L7_9BACT|nr:ribbon-helix-helix protein, CopG family [Gaoshiqia sediminis]MCW0483493.1 ribbon-helix-helix protein, CopG family [Gaoshiqia sediminis]
MDHSLSCLVSARLTIEDSRYLEYMCAKRQMSRSEFVRQLIIHEIKKEEIKAEHEQ